MLTIHTARDGQTWYGRPLYRVTLTNDINSDVFHTRRMPRFEAHAYAAYVALTAGARNNQVELTGEYTGEGI